MFDQIFSDDCNYIIKNTKLSKIKKKKVLFLGANSFFALYLQSVLVLKNCKITSISLNKPKGYLKKLISKKKINFYKFNLNNEKKLKSILSKNFDYIFHCATYGQPKKWNNNFYNTINLNTKILKMILEHSLKYNSRILYCSSAAVYETSNKKKLSNEKSKLTFGNYLNENFYSISKILGEKLCKYYKYKYKLPIYIVRPAHTYGPGQDFRYDYRVLPQLVKRALIEKKVYIYDKGKSIRSWTYISDVTIMLLNIIQHGKHLIYNVCGNEYKSIYQIAKTISTSQNLKKVEIKKKKLNFTNPNHDKLILSSKRYNNEFPKLKYINFKKGVKRFIEWNKKISKTD